MNMPACRSDKDNCATIADIYSSKSSEMLRIQAVGPKNSVSMDVVADTGANITVIKAENLQDLDWIVLEPTNMHVRGYSGVAEPCVGKAKIKIKVGSHAHLEEVYFSLKATSNFLSKDACKAFGIIPKGFPYEQLNAIKGGETPQTVGCGGKPQNFACGQNPQILGDNFEKDQVRRWVHKGYRTKCDGTQRQSCLKNCQCSKTICCARCNVPRTNGYSLNQVIFERSGRTVLPTLEESLGSKDVRKLNRWDKTDVSISKPEQIGEKERVENDWTVVSYRKRGRKNQRMKTV